MKASALAVALAGSLAAQQVEVPVVEGGVTLRGAAARTDVVIPVFRPTNTPEVALSLEASELLDLEESRITVLVDDEPRRSVRLSDLDGDLRVALTPEEGFKRLSLRGRLRVAGDPCMVEHPEGAWLRVLPRSTVRYRQAPVAAGATASSVVGMPELWRGMGAEEVYLELPRTDDVDALLAFVDVDHLLRDWGFSPRYGAAPQGAARVEVHLGVLDPPVDWPQAGTDPQVSGVAHARGATLHLQGDDGVGLGRLAMLLRDGEAASLCRGSTCMVGPAFQPTSVTTATADPDAPVLTVGGVGYPTGWATQGPGRNQLRMVWQRPPWWTLQRWPELRLRVRFSDQADWRAGMPALSIRLNGQPLASYGLDAMTSNLAALSVRVPPQFWTDDAWVFEINTHLAERGESCEASDPDAVWMVVEPESGLHMPRTEARFDGIAEFFDTGPVPTLTGDLAGAGAHVEALAKVLHAYRPRMAGSFVWREDCRDACLEILPAVASERDFLVALDGAARVVDQRGDRRIPVLNGETRYQLARTEEGLALGLPPGPGGDAMPAPDLRALRGVWAVTDGDRWVVRGPEEPTSRVQVGTPADPEDVALSAEQLRARLINFLWIVAVLSLAIVGAFWVWRGHRDAKRGEADDIEFYGES